jgi:hypothetical protein
MLTERASITNTYQKKKTEKQPSLDLSFPSNSHISSQESQPRQNKGKCNIIEVDFTEWTHN